MTQEEKIENLQTEVWKTVDGLFNNDELPQINDVYAASAVMLQTAIELYTVVLPDEDIARIMELTLETLPDLRERMRKRLGTRVLH